MPISYWSCPEITFINPNTELLCLPQPYSSSSSSSFCFGAFSNPTLSSRSICAVKTGKMQPTTSSTLKLRRQFNSFALAKQRLLCRHVLAACRKGPDCSPCAPLQKSHTTWRPWRCNIFRAASGGVSVVSHQVNVQARCPGLPYPSGGGPGWCRRFHGNRNHRAPTSRKFELLVREQQCPSPRYNITTIAR